MKRHGLTGIYGCFVLLVFAAVSWSAPVPDTGQTKCYNNSIEIPCPSLGELFYGQDGNYSINPMSYTKLGENGVELSESASEWIMVRDNVTGLIWEMKTDDDTIHDKDNTYTWYDSNTATNGGYAGTPGNGMDTENFIKALNDAYYGGNNDWRLPTIKELVSIVKYDIPGPGPAINTTYFPNTQSSFYWSSTTRASHTSNAWSVHFYYGIANNYVKSSRTYVRAVRGGQAGSLGNSMNGPLEFVGGEFLEKASTDAGVYTDNGDGTVTDSATGLMWQQSTDNSMTWELSLSHCENSTLADYTDWRLPTQKELKSIVDYSRSFPAINITYFPNMVPQSVYWSSTTDTRNVAWCVDFGFGGDSGYFDKNYGAYVRAVRGGQSRLPGNLIILTPNQADIWDIGSQKDITWDTQSISGDVAISISRDGGITFTSIADVASNNGSYIWTVAGPESVNCMMKIEPINYPDKGTVQGLFAISSQTNSLPVAICHDVTIPADSNCSATASIDNGSYDPDGDPITLSQSPSGPYPLGNTLVTLTVTDDKGASCQCTGTVTVVDSTAPTITTASTNPSVIWPPNKKMVDVTINYSATDNCNQLACQISSITSNEPISSLDYAIVDAHHVKLKADRLGSGNGRTYTITITCTDVSGNSTKQAVTVTVPHDQGKNK